MKHFTSIFILFVLLTGNLISQPENTNSYVAPKFPNGPKEFALYAQKFINYPISNSGERLSGVVDVTIYINKEGKVKLVRTAGPNLELNNETKRVSKLSPNWNPGSRNGNPIDTIITLKFYYCLEKPNSKATANDVCIVVFKEALTEPDIKKMELKEKEYAIKNGKAITLNEEGSSLMQAKKIEEAVRKFSEAIELVGMRNAFLYNRGLAYLNLKQDDNAKADFLEAYRKGDEDSGKIYNDFFK